MHTNYATFCCVVAQVLLPKPPAQCSCSLHPSGVASHRLCSPLAISPPQHPNPAHSSPPSTPRVDVPACAAPCSVHLMLLLEPPAPGAPPAVHHLASLPALPPPAAAEAQRLLLKQVAAAPLGAAAALCALAPAPADGADTDAARGDRASLPPPGAWPLLPAAARRAIEWAWQEHFSPFARDLSYAAAGPGPAGARAALLEALLGFAAAAGMTDTALHLLHSAARGGVIRLVAPDTACAAAAAGWQGARVVRADGLGDLCFVVNSGGDDDGADAAAVPDAEHEEPHGPAGADHDGAEAPEAPVVAPLAPAHSMAPAAPAQPAPATPAAAPCVAPAAVPELPRRQPLAPRALLAALLAALVFLLLAAATPLARLRPGFVPGA